MKKKKVLICGAAPVYKKYIKKKVLGSDYIVAVDGGYDNLLKLGLKPHIYIGDLDSVKNKILCKKKISSKDKDESDLSLALKYVFKNFSDIEEIFLLGVISARRLDHTFSNIFTLLEYNANFHIIARGYEVFVLNRGGKYFFDRKLGDRVSIFTFSRGQMKATGLKYKIPKRFKTSSHGISNETVSKKITLDVISGKFLIIFFDGKNY